MRGAGQHPLLNICWQPGLLSAVIATTELVLPPACICISQSQLNTQPQLLRVSRQGWNRLLRKPPKMTTGWVSRDVLLTGSTHIAEP